MNAMNVINVTSNQIKFDESLSTSARKYADRFNRSSERFYAFKIMVEKKTEGLQAIIIAKKSRLKMNI